MDLKITFTNKLRREIWKNKNDLQSSWCFNIFIFLCKYSGNTLHAQTKTTPTKSKIHPDQTQSLHRPNQNPPKSSKTEPVKKKDPGTVTIGTQIWAVANLNVNTFRNGDSIPEARTPQEWVAAGEAGKPAWCYYNNDPANGLKYGKLYNWYAVNDPRELAPAGWTLPSDADWAELTHYLKGQQWQAQK